MLLSGVIESETDSINAIELEPTEGSDIDEVDIDAANIDELAEASIEDHEVIEGVEGYHG